ncbi:MAG TPA: histidine kinase [Gaiellaceae bacterium]|nr:histidine kinase [Gaiellaceae bacterium]
MDLGRLIRIYGDWALALGLAALFQLEVWTVDPSHPPGDVGTAFSSGERAVAAAGGLVFTLSLAWRRRAPLVVLAVAIVTMLLANLVSALDAPATPAIALVVAVYSVGAHTAGLRASIGALGVAGVIGVIAARQLSLADVLFIAMIVGGAWLAGRAIRHRRLRETQLEREKAEAEAAIAEERTRIARELHDVVAHAISVIVLQARGGRKLLDAEPEEARQALDAIERTASQALGEMRRLLGLLRESDAELALAPQPTLSRLEDLVGQVREAGLPVEVAVEGEPRELPPGVDLSAYRIVQEALTNALKHAGPATARVTVRYGDGELDLEISDDGVGAGNGGGAGQGLAGIRERVAVFGGDVETGQRPEGGYAVRARLPYASER